MVNLNLTKEKLEALRSEYKHRNVRGKYPRQKMLPEYQFIYPWVLPDETDPYFAFCTICECRLNAKRSDLGKHEGSIKHTENAATRGLGPEGGGLILKGSHGHSFKLEPSDAAIHPSEVTASEEDEEESSNEIYVKQEPMIDLIESNSSSTLHFEELNHNNKIRDLTSLSRDSGDVNEEDDDLEDSVDENYSPPLKRRTSEADSPSQHSNVSDPTSVPANGVETSANQRLSMREISPAAIVVPASNLITLTTTTTPTYPTQNNCAATAPTAQAPCKITIKKIIAPVATTNSTQIPSTATILPIANSLNISQKSMNRVQSPMPPTTIVSASSLSATGQVRDSFDLFFESICSSVKSLPPKLATEGKIRVMQLIGELEMRAIVERELEHSKAMGQNNPTLASTTI